MGPFINDVTLIGTFFDTPPLYVTPLCPNVTLCFTPFPSLCDVIYEWSQWDTFDKTHLVSIGLCFF